jgi:hypothetical protein
MILKLALSIILIILIFTDFFTTIANKYIIKIEEFKEPTLFAFEMNNQRNNIRYWA